ncbi:hypothetical protein BC831DRAFT_439882 [Entophlyctis helioformis]|nr:hypothetical protein BC831DRAFT_439882 [Entophlyctis helioformis]
MRVVITGQRPAQWKMTSESLAITAMGMLLGWLAYSAASRAMQTSASWAHQQTLCGEVGPSSILRASAMWPLWSRVNVNEWRRACSSFIASCLNP